MSIFGTFLHLTTFGESHCLSVGATIENMPPRICLLPQDIQDQLNRRKPGQSKLTTSRNENDTIIILSGIENNLTLGTPITVIVNNQDTRPSDYNNLNTDQIPRPSHADYTYQAKYGIKASSGGGRSSARETIGRVIGGTICEKWLLHTYGIKIIAYVSSVGLINAPIELENIDLTREEIDKYETRCPHLETNNKIIECITKVAEEKDSIGGTITCIISNVPAGLGEPVFQKVEAYLASAMMSIPASKGFEIGSGFNCSKMKGSEHNDMFVYKDELNGLGTKTNNSGGVQGGITNGENIVFRVPFKPAATIGQIQHTSNFLGDDTYLGVKGRHDPCIVLRAVPIVESMAALVLADLALIQLARVASTTALQPASLSLQNKELEVNKKRRLNNMLNFL